MNEALKDRTICPVSQTKFGFKECISQGYTEALVKYLCSSTFFDQGGLFKSDPSQYIVSVKSYPFRIGKYFGYSTRAEEESSLQNGSFHVGTLAEVTDIPTFQPDAGVSDNRFFLVSTFTVPKFYGNFMDYFPYTKIEMYLPFSSVVTLDNNDVVGQTINLYITVDFETGDCKYWIVRTSDNTILMTADGKIGFDIPIGSTNANENAKTMMASAVALTGGVVATIASGNPMTLLGSAMNFGKSMVGAIQQKVTKGTTSGGMGVFASTFKPYIIYTRQQPADENNNYAYVKGRPLYKSYAYVIAQGVSSIGFTVFDNPKCQGSAGIATDSELAELESLLSSGVYI